ncbi:MAG TPA: hypothetical protein VH601_24475 [Bryobacteraceae bacterium]|jgi:hypothetical protein
MCDYSLMNVPNRLATEGEELITYKFPSGSIGLITLPNLQRIVSAERCGSKGLRSLFTKVIRPTGQLRAIAVCVPPGARLRMQSIPERLQCRLEAGANEEVTFTQITAATNRYRDAIQFHNGKEVLLQELRTGQRFRVLDLSLANEREPALEQAQPVWR